MIIMKKVLAILAGLLVFAAAASAQSRALGVRAGLSGVEVSYQQSFGTPNFLEMDLGASFRSDYTGISLMAAYDFVFASANNWNFYAGPAAGLCFVKVKDAGSAVVPAVGGQVGIEYVIPGAPLNFSLDYRPMLVYSSGNAAFSSADIALGIRYRF